MSPTARTLAHLRRLGFLADVCQRWLPRVNRHRDLFGIGDVLGIHSRGRAVLLVQCTRDGHVSDRLKRIRARPELSLLLAAGLAVEVWGWSLRAGAGISAAWPSAARTCPPCYCRRRPSGAERRRASARGCCPSTMPRLDAAA